MRNAKEEFLEHIKDRIVRCVSIKIETYDDETYSLILLPVGHTLKQYNTFLEHLDFEYDSGYGGQLLFGTIWYTTQTWSTRGEYDGSEWWEYNKMPLIPNELRTSKL